MDDQEKSSPAAPSKERGYGTGDDVGSPTTQQMRAVGQRRRDAERKLDQHLEEARHKAELPDPDEQKTES
ncbi:hypothetical protein [Paenarthrobacter ureafaciens]|uniref:hypothetical protein n=1 Tax=Paenarthrobacter ureafaciens TaxID=37931 RepID=UPI001FB290E3|nr:hypothetical protein [Paenarthrobacter ureafaciens]UOD81102.1 hypothetical protein MQZ73_18680 [Paenarthrobacter ureafaciens]WNZ03761.1 hypothetical protein PVT25_19335 [Paenarthrobacter ureafaciens]